MSRTAILLLCCLSGLRSAHGDPVPVSTERTAPQVLLIVKGSRASGKLLQNVEDQLLTSRHYRIVLMQGLVPLMQQADNQAAIRSKSAQIIEEGRQAMVALDQALALSRLTAARDLLAQSFVRYYDARILAQVHLLLGVVYLEQQARPDLARQEFVEVHQLDSSFALDAHYSPRVRTAFTEAEHNLPQQPVPPPDDVERLARLAGATAAMVLTVQEAGEQSLVQGSMFLAERGAYTTVESRLVSVTDADRSQRQTTALGGQLRRMLEVRFPLPGPPPKRIKKPKQAKQPIPPPPPPWYLRWYTLATAGVVVTAAIVLPLTLRTKTSDLEVRW